MYILKLIVITEGLPTTVEQIYRNQSKEKVCFFLGDLYLSLQTDPDVRISYYTEGAELAYKRVDERRDTSFCWRVEYVDSSED